MLGVKNINSEKIDNALQRFAVKIVNKGRHQQIFDPSGNLENLEEIKIQTEEIKKIKNDTLKEILFLLR